MKRIALAGIAALASVATGLAVPLESHADERVIAAPLSSGFLNSNVTIDRGEKLTFLNPDIAPHDVTSQDPGLFASETVGAGSEVSVAGAEALTQGSYAFICSVHPNMKGTLTVGSGGSGGGGHAGHDMKAPKLSVKALDSRISEVLDAGAIGLQVKLNEAATVRAVATDAGHGMTIAKGRAKLGAGTGNLAARLTGAGKRMLRSANKLSLELTLSAEDAAGNAAKRTATAKLR